MQAPTGKPLPSPLATVTMSAVTPEAVLASQSPQRPMPVCTSSSHSSAPAERVSSRTCARNSDGGSTTPFSPWIGSRITAATVSSSSAARASTSP